MSHKAHKPNNILLTHKIHESNEKSVNPTLHRFSFNLNLL